jgi:glycosyltransferase involved in cell wall biosynthesis
MKIIFITNLCPSYRLKPFQRLAELYNLTFFFYSRPDDAVASHLEIVSEVEKLKYLPAWEIIMRLLTGGYQIVIKCTNGRYITIFSFLIAKLMRKKFILWHTFWYTPQTLFRRLTMPILRWIWRHSNAIVVYGEQGRKYLESFGVDRKKIFIAWQAIDNKLFSKMPFREELDAIRIRYNLVNKKIVLFVGRLVEVKGLPYLIQAVGQLHDDGIGLIMIGEGPLKGSLERLSRDNGLKYPVFIDKIQNSDLFKYYALADVFVLPSITTKEVKEAWGLVVNEAMNQGTPVIVTDAVGAGVGGLVQDGVNGFVVPEQDSRSLAVALRKILYDDALRAMMRQNAKQIIQDWTYERMVKGFSDAIEYAQGGKK